ncbi:MAG: DUF3108 domain-containing protein [Pseudomonadota bacterium]
MKAKAAIRAGLWMPLLLIAALSPAGPAAANGDVTIEGRIDLYIGGLKGAEGDFNGTLAADGTYSARTELRGAGLVRRVYQARVEAEVAGRMEAGDFRPGAYSLSTRFGSDRQEVNVDFNGDRPEVVVAEPPFRPRPWQIAPEAQVGTIDPVTAALFLAIPERAEQVCDRSVEIFDGRRRTRITVRQPRPAFVEGEVICDVTYTRVSGWSPRRLRDATAFDFVMTLRPIGDGMMQPYKLEGDTSVGRAVAILRD